MGDERPGGRAVATRESRYWVFDSPLIRDPLFLVSLAGGVVIAIFNWLNRPEAVVGGVSYVILFFTVWVPSGLFFVGGLGGAVREYRRGRRDGRATNPASSGATPEPSSQDGVRRSGAVD